MSGNYGKVLLIEDDQVTAELVRSLLEEARFEVAVALDGPSGLARARAEAFDVMVLDVNLPGLDGLTLCLEIRKVCQSAILFLSSRGEDLDKVIGLEAGADDYLSKPFNARELVARVRALLRRSRRFPETPPEVEGTARWGELQIDEEARELRVAGQPVHLTATEFSLLLAFTQRAGRVLSRQQLMDLVWGADWVGDERTVDVHLRHLRNKILELHPHDYFPAVRGRGYKFVVPDAR